MRAARRRKPDSRAVFAVGVEGGEEVLCGFVAQGSHEGDSAVAGADVGTGAEHGCGGRSLEAFGALVGDVEHGRHFVAIACFKSSGREAHAFDHVAVDGGQAFLLTGTHEEGAMEFDAVEVDHVFVERAAAYVVLGRQFVVCGHTGLRGDGLFYRVAPDRRCAAEMVEFHLLHRGGLHALSASDGFAEQCTGSGEHHVDAEGVGVGEQGALSRLVANHGEDDGEAVGRGDAQGVSSVEIGSGDEEGASLDAHGGQFDGVSLVVAHGSEDATTSLGDPVDDEAAQNDEKREETLFHTLIVTAETRIYCRAGKCCFMFCSRCRRQTSMPYLSLRCSARCCAA